MVIASYKELKAKVNGKKDIIAIYTLPDGSMGYINDGYMDGFHYYQLSIYNGRLWSDIRYLEDGRAIDIPDFDFL